jgi:hypothetical protein
MGVNLLSFSYSTINRWEEKRLIETAEKLCFSAAVKCVGGGGVALLKKDARTFSAISISKIANPHQEK